MHHIMAPNSAYILMVFSRLIFGYVLGLVQRLQLFAEREPKH